MSQKFGLLASSGWFFTTLMSAFIAANLFRTVSEVQEAGAMGIKMFGTLNYLELIFALTIISWAFLSKKKLWLKLVALLLFLIPLSYTAYFTPGIKSSTAQMNETRTVDPSRFDDAATEHEFYHHTYVKIEKLKLILLLLMMVMIFRDDQTRKEVL